MKLKPHHKLLLSRLGVPMTVASGERRSYRTDGELVRLAEVLSTRIAFGTFGQARTKRERVHRVRIMEPGRTSVTFVDCEVC